MRIYPPSISNAIPTTKAAAMKTAIIQPILFAAFGIGTALHAANADNPNIEIAGALDTPNMMICLNAVKPITANLRNPPVNSRFSRGRLHHRLRGVGRVRCVRGSRAVRAG